MISARDTAAGTAADRSTGVEEGVLETVHILGLELSCGTKVEVAKWIVDLARKPEDFPSIVSHVNVHNGYMLLRDPELLECVQRECRMVFEGIGMRIGSHLSGRGRRTDLNGTDLAPLIFARAARAKVPLFFLGAEDDIVNRAVTCMRQAHPGIQIVGVRGGYFSSDREDEVVAEVRESEARILVQGRGFPLQERFAMAHRQRLGVGLIWNVGGLFDFLSGSKPRAPFAMRRLHLEWLYRLAREPRRLWRRSAISAPWMLRRALRERLELRMGD